MAVVSMVSVLPSEQERGAVMAGERIKPEGATRRAYERSTIGFPYGDLDDAVEIARKVHDNAGMGCTIDQLAGWMRQNTTSGAFRLRLSTGRIFGLIEIERGEISLTQLGRRIVDPSLERDARATAFMAVPLYKAVYDKYRGHMLPPAAALRREMGALGVASKQTDKARWAFERSAEQAGFFAQGSDRLITPSGTQPPETRPLETRRKEHQRPLGTGGELPPLHPFIEGLLSKLPEPETEWPVQDRARWLQTAANIFSLMYKGDGEVDITAKHEG